MLKRDRGVIDSSENSAAKRAIILNSIGEVVEWFDFMVYLSLAPVLAKVIFAPDDSFSLVMTLGIFGAAFLARPIGAILFGHLGDRFGRKRALVTSALLMAMAKMAEGLLATYSTAGTSRRRSSWWHVSPPGVSLGGEFTSTAVMLFESTQPRRRGLTTSLANIMGGVGVFLARLGRAVNDKPFSRGHGELGLARPLLRRLTHRSGGTRHSRSRSGNTPLREIAEQGKNGPDTFARESKKPTAPSFSHSR